MTSNVVSGFTPWFDQVCTLRKEEHLLVILELQCKPGSSSLFSPENVRATSIIVRRLPSNSSQFATAARWDPLIRRRSAIASLSRRRCFAIACCSLMRAKTASTSR